MEFLIKTKHCFSLLLYFLFAHSAATDLPDSQLDRKKKKRNSQLDSSVTNLILKLELPDNVYVPVVKTDFSVNIIAQINV